jgi:putative FmdB family regulatory protein
MPPVYDWDCPKCKHEFIIETTVSDRRTQVQCPKCGEDAIFCEVPKVAPMLSGVDLSNKKMYKVTADGQDLTESWDRKLSKLKKK